MLFGIIIGYDPGGNGHHGVAELEVNDGRAVKLSTHTMGAAEEVISFLESKPSSSLIALGVDTLTCWSTGEGGWRPADRWLAQRFKTVRSSVISPNRLYGAMTLNGMSVLLEVRRMRRDLPITETHPKVLYQCLSQGAKYDYDANGKTMDAELESWLGVPVNAGTDHEWDAAISAYAALEGRSGRWTNDLHLSPQGEGERLIKPCGETSYFWPQ